MDPYQTEWHVDEERRRRRNVKKADLKSIEISFRAPTVRAVFVAGAADFQGKLLSAKRYGFGGHPEKPGK